MDHIIWFIWYGWVLSRFPRWVHLVTGKNFNPFGDKEEEMKMDSCSSYKYYYYFSNLACCMVSLRNSSFNLSFSFSRRSYSVVSLPSSSSSLSWRRFSLTFSSIISSRLTFKLSLSNSWFFMIATFFFKCLTRASASCFVPIITPLITRRILQKRANTINAENEIACVSRRLHRCWWRLLMMTLRY